MLSRHNIVMMFQVLFVDGTQYYITSDKTDLGLVITTVVLHSGSETGEQVTNTK